MKRVNGIVFGMVGAACLLIGDSPASMIVAGGLLAAGIVYLLSLSGGVTGGYRLILIGIGISIFVRNVSY